MSGHGLKFDESSPLVAQRHWDRPNRNITLTAKAINALDKPNHTNAVLQKDKPGGHNIHRGLPNMAVGYSSCGEKHTDGSPTTVLC